MRYLYCLSFLVLLGCTESPPDFDVDAPVGMKPVYAGSASQEIALEDPKPIQRAGKIYSYGDLLLVGEKEEGFHVLDNSNPHNPEHVLFVAIPGNEDFAIKDGIVYADNYFDLLALEITMDTVIVTKRISLLPTNENGSMDFPPVHDTYFECVDPEKGEVIGWIQTTLDKPECYRP